MNLSGNKTKLVCTIGPASDSPTVMKELLSAGMNVARLNFSHGDFDYHRRNIENLRVVAATLGRHLAIMADLPGPKMRIGEVSGGGIELAAGDKFMLTTREMAGSRHGASVSFERLPQVVKEGDALFLNDGLVQLKVEQVCGDEVSCHVDVGGEISSRKGLNLPGIDLGIPAFTERDRECLEFALNAGVDAVSQSFVESAADIFVLRKAAADFGFRPFVLAKIERASSLSHVDEILDAADGIMIARGDLGVEIPVERIAVTQKQLIQKSLRAGKPAITATQMLESMTQSRQPTRAEATDVANAVLDGTDCVMLSAESAVGRHPVEAAKTLARIASATEPYQSPEQVHQKLRVASNRKACSRSDLLGLGVESIREHSLLASVVVPTLSGEIARSITRFRLPVWIAAVSPSEETCRQLQFSYGVHAIHQETAVDQWDEFAREWVSGRGLRGDLVIVARGPSPLNPDVNPIMELVDLA